MLVIWMMLCKYMVIVMVCIHFKSWLHFHHRPRSVERGNNVDFSSRHFSVNLQLTAKNFNFEFNHVDISDFLDLLHHLPLLASTLKIPTICS